VAVEGFTAGNAPEASKICNHRWRRSDGGGAIDIVMPDADHRLCIWHIEQNAMKRFGGPKRKDFRKFIYHAMEKSEYDSLCREFKDTHNIKEDNLWINRMYELRYN
jgi:zinc finger SWIM domain-containing protein 3